jgi:hypothetical protein
VEKRGVIDSLKRSSALTKGYRWLVFVTFFIVLICSGVIEGALEIAITGAGGKTATLIVLVIWNGISLALSTILAVVVYHNLRSIKEGMPRDTVTTVFE